MQEHIKKRDDGKITLIYKTHTKAAGLIELYGSNLKEAIKRRDKIARESLRYVVEKLKI